MHEECKLQFTCIRWIKHWSASKTKIQKRWYYPTPRRKLIKEDWSDNSWKFYKWIFGHKSPS